MHLCTSQTWLGILVNSTCEGQRNKPVSHCRGRLQRRRTDATWQSHSLKSGSSPGEVGLVSRSGNIVLRWLWSEYSRTTEVQDLQCCVDVDKDDDYQIENGPNDAQHSQNALLLTLLVFDSLFLITVEIVYHFPRKSLQFSSQTSLERVDKREKGKHKPHVSHCNCNSVFERNMVDCDNENEIKFLNMHVDVRTGSLLWPYICIWTQKKLWNQDEIHKNRLNLTS